MRGLKLIVVSIFLLLLLPAVGMHGTSQESRIPFWKTGWPYRQQVQLPINTNDSSAKFQPIDLRILFANPCWTVNVNDTSVRVCSWFNGEWHELESQIYSLKWKTNDTDHITECNVVFLVPDFADGTEDYFIYYSEKPTQSPAYVDHVNVVDANYSYSPLPDVSAQAKFYGISEDGNCIYGVGQDGQILDRSSAQVIVKQQKGTNQFDILNSDQIVSFAFSYFNGSREKDESSSDQVFLDKKILIDGNLMVSFGIMSESESGDIRTTVIYKYYYCPLDDKRMEVHVKHEMMANATVQGIDNVDGRFGSIISLKARSAKVQALNFGTIYPNIDFYGMDNQIEEYSMDPNPNTKDREWIISYTDNADLGSEAWISYGDGMQGTANAVLFAANQGVVTSGTDERDGIQLKVAEKQYFNFLGTEVDYASINFGRNSYEPGYYHDLTIPYNLVVQFDAEVYYSTTGGYEAVQNESHVFQALAKSRYFSGDEPFEQEETRYNVTVITHFGGTRLSFPWFSNKTENLLPVMWIELFQDGKLLQEGAANRSIFIRASRTFHDLLPGDYLIKVYWKKDNATKMFTGARSLVVDENTRVHVFCTWERLMNVTFTDQHGQAIKGIHVMLLDKNGEIFDENTTQNNGQVLLRAPFNSKDPYTLKADYKDFIVYDNELKKTLRKLDMDIDIELYNLTVEVTDALHLPPGVDITPTIITTQYNKTIQLTPENHGKGLYFYPAIPPGRYTIQLEYGDTLNQLVVTVPTDNDFVHMNFTTLYKLNIALYDSTGNVVNQQPISFMVFRDNQMVFKTNQTQFTLPPASYTLQAYADGSLVGIKDVTLVNDRHIIFVTSLDSIIPFVAAVSSILFLVAALVFTVLRKFSVISFLKCFAIVLVILALFQPWWGISGMSSAPAAQRNTTLYIDPGVMVESTVYAGKTSLSLAEMPDAFITFLDLIVPILILLSIVLCSSVLLKKLKKRNYSSLMSVIGVVIVVILLAVFYIGTQKLCETSIGPVQGQGILDVSIGNSEVHMQSAWGFGIGYYLIILAALLVILAMILELRLLIKKKRR